MPNEPLRVIEGGFAGADDGPEPLPITIDPELEATVCANIVYQGQLIEAFYAIVRPEHFESEAYRQICKAAYTIHERGQPVDPVSVAHEIKNTERLAQVGGMARLIAFAGEMPVITRFNVLSHAERVRELWVRRKYRDLGRLMTSSAESDPTPIGELLEKTRGAVDAQIGALVAVQEQGRVDAIANKIVGQMTGGAPPSKGTVRTGFPSIDRVTGGLPMDLSILAGLPGEAKTSLATAIAHNIASDGGGVLIVSLETEREQLFRRMAAARAGISMQRAVSGELRPNELGPFLGAIRELQPLPIFIEDAPTSARGVHARCQRVQLALHLQGKKLSLVLVDYLQMMQPLRRREERFNEIADSARALKNIAVDVGVPILALSQLNEGKVEARKEARPTVADLAGSSEIRRCARLILGLYRADAHAKSASYQPTGVAEVEVLKANNGAKGGVAYLRFDGPSASFSDDGAIAPPPDPSRALAGGYTCGGCGCRNEAGVSCRCGTTQAPPAEPPAGFFDDMLGGA